MKWSYTKRNFPVYSGNLCKSWSLFAMFTVVDRLGTNGCYGKMMEATLNFGCTLNLLLFSYGWNPNVEAARLLNALVKFDKHFGTRLINKFDRKIYSQWGRKQCSYHIIIWHVILKKKLFRKNTYLVGDLSRCTKNSIRFCDNKIRNYNSHLLFWGALNSLNFSHQHKDRVKYLLLRKG